MNVSDENASSFLVIEVCGLKIGEVYHRVRKGTLSEPMGRNGGKMDR
jgi:hypothetical protein